MGCLDQQPSHFGVTLFGDSSVVGDIAGSAEDGTQAEEGGDITTALEAIGVIDGEDEVEGDDGADAWDGVEVLHDRVRGSGGFEAFVESLDFSGDLFDLGEQGLDDRSEFIRHFDLCTSFVKAAGGASWDSIAEASEDAPGRVDPF